MVDYSIPSPKASPKTKKRRTLGTTSLAPVTIMAAMTIGALLSRKVLRVLCDSGSTKTLIKRSVLPKHAKPKKTKTKRFNTLAGNMNTSEIVTMRDVRLLEFNKNRSIEEHKALVFDQENCRYDVILGANFLNKAGMVIDYLEKNFKWFGDIVPLRVPSELLSVDYVMMVERSNVEA